MSTSTPYPPIKQHFERVLNELEKSKTVTDETEKELITEYGTKVKEVVSYARDEKEIAQNIDRIIFFLIFNCEQSFEDWSDTIFQLKMVRDMFFELDKERVTTLKKADNYEQ